MLRMETNATGSGAIQRLGGGGRSSPGSPVTMGGDGQKNQQGRIWEQAKTTPSHPGSPGRVASPAMLRGAQHLPVSQELQTRLPLLSGSGTGALLFLATGLRCVFSLVLLYCVSPGTIFLQRLEKKSQPLALSFLPSPPCHFRRWQKGTSRDIRSIAGAHTANAGP